ncbi:hypothetical protein WDW86_13830 [Bdellovibrionota bacterium FG-2]
MWNHWTVRANAPYQPFKQFEEAHPVWNSLRTHFPDALGAVLMPNHFHLLLPASLRLVAPAKIAGLLSSISKRQGIAQLWQPRVEPTVIPDLRHLKRQVRYVALNPCRSDLCNDPLEWIWSTYRDVAGATVQPWVKAETLACILGERQRDFRVRFHAYVSGDPSVAVEGTAPPKPAEHYLLPHYSIGEILIAAAAASRRSIKDVAQNRSAVRMIFVHLAHRHGWSYPALLAKICETSPRAIRYILELKLEHSALEAADLCLGDARLRWGYIGERLGLERVSAVGKFEALRGRG